MEYVAMERGYEATLQDLPGNWATRENITKWISSGLSVAMVDERISVAQDYINYDVNPEVRRELRDIYGLTDQEMVAYVLSDQANKDRLANEWDKRVRQANVGAAARSFGIGIDDNLRDSIASSSDSTYTYGQTAAAFSNIADQAESYRRLGAISGYRTSTDDLVADEFNLAGGAEARKMKRRLASQERGRFSGSSSIGRGSLARGGLGSQ